MFPNKSRLRSLVLLAAVERGVEEPRGLVLLSTAVLQVIARSFSNEGERGSTATIPLLDISSVLCTA